MQLVVGLQPRGRAFVFRATGCVINLFALMARGTTGKVTARGEALCNDPHSGNGTSGYTNSNHTPLIPKPPQYFSDLLEPALGDGVQGDWASPTRPAPFELRQGRKAAAVEGCSGATWVACPFFIPPIIFR